MNVKRLNIEALQEALNNDGKISPEEHEYLITQGIPDRLLDALEDGVLDEAEIADLKSLGFSDRVLQAFADGNLSDEEKVWVKEELGESMRKWREKQLQAAFAKFNKIFEK